MRTGRASPHLLDRVIVDYYGAETPLKQLANVAATDARLLTLTPFDKNAIGLIEKAIQESDLGLTPSNDGNVIRLQIPDLTEERRREMVKVVHGVGEGGKVSIRNVRRDVMHDLRELKKDGDIGEDDERRAESELQRLTDEADQRHRRGAQGQGSRDPGSVSGAVPRYVAIITDGNGRWAEREGVPTLDGHRAGADVVKERLRDAARLGVEELTVFSFSTENWQRSPDEVSGLMRMFGERIRSETPELDEEGVRMRFVGRREGISRGADRADGLGRGDDRGQRAHHALRRLQLRRAGRDRRRRAELSRRAPRRSSARTSTRRTCTTRTSSSAPAASSGSRTTSSGSARTRSSSSATSSGPTSPARPSRSPSPSSTAGAAASARDRGHAADRSPSGRFAHA